MTMFVLLIGNVMTIWSLVIMTVGLSEVGGVSGRRAFATLFTAGVVFAVLVVGLFFLIPTGWMAGLLP